MVSRKINQWLEIVQRWEDDSTQKNLTYVMDSINRNYDNQPHAKVLFGLLAAFAANIYCNAYSYDNITRVLYSKYAMGLDGLNKLNANEFDKQMKLVKEILKTMPKGFSDYSYLNGTFLQVPEGTPLTLNKANQFIDYIQSSKFDDVIMNIVTSDFRKSLNK